MIISITELHVKSLWKFPKFARLSMHAMQQAQSSSGVMHASARGGWLKGMTMTAWKDEASMMVFRNSGAHKAAMKELKDVSSSYRTLWYEVDELPTWKSALQKLGSKPLVQL